MHQQPMFQTCQPLILASSSPRRIQLLSQFGIVFEVIPAVIEEAPFPGEVPEKFVRRMAESKAYDVALHHPHKWTVGADTLITLDGRSILGKPGNRDDALSILRRLSGNTHQVITGFCLTSPDKKITETQVESTQVTFIDASDEMLHAYIATGEPLDKAGAYGIQGLGSILVREIKGSCSNVIGLPLSSLISLLMKYKIIAPVP